MHLSAQLFINTLSAKNLKFDFKEDSDGDVIVKFPYDGRITTYIFSGDEGNYVSMYTLFESVPKEKFIDVLIVCNTLNTTYKWLKFYLDKDNDLMVQDDAIVTPDTAADECFELLLRRINILNEVKPMVMRAIYGGNS